MKLSDVVNRINGNVDRYTTDLLYYIGGEHFESNELEITNKAIIKDNLGILGFKFHFAFQDRDVIFMARNPHLRKAGMVRFSGLCSDASYILRSKDENILTQEYLAIQLQSDHFWDYCESHKVGSVNFANNWSSIANYEFDLPTIDKQREIADKVWAAYEVKKAYRSMIKATDEMVKSQFIEMFGSKSSGDKWPIKYLSEIVDPNCPISYGIVQPGDELEDGVPIVRPVDLNSNYYVYKNGLKRTTEAISNSYKRTILRGDELLLCVRGTTGVMGLATEELKGGNVTRGITPLYFKDGFNRIYLLGAFLSDDVQAYIKDNTVGSTLKGINMERVRKIQIPIPPIEIQNKWEEVFKQADKSKFMRSKSQFIEMFGSMDTTPVGEYVLDSFPGEWGIEDTNGTGVKVIRTTNFTNSGKLNLTDVITREIEMKKVNKKRIMKYDTILERSGGTTDNPVGRVVLFEEDGLYLCNNFTQVLRFKDIDPRFAFYSLFYFYQTNKTAIRGMGNKTTGIQNLNMSKYLGIGIPNASIEQQKAFTAIAEQADKSKLICLLWKHCHCRDVYTK